MNILYCSVFTARPHFSALLAMQTAVIAKAILSVRPSVRLSVTFGVNYRAAWNADAVLR